MMQSGATILKPIIDTRVNDLRALLQSIGNDVTGNTMIPFARLPSVHFMSWFIVEHMSDGPHLFLEINVDGRIEAFLHELVGVAGGGIDRIYGHCAGYPSGGAEQIAQVVEYLVADNVGYDCYYIGWRGLEAQRIVSERLLRSRLEELLDRAGRIALKSMGALGIHAMQQQSVDADPTLAWARSFPKRPFLVRYRRQVLRALKILAGFGVAIIVGLGIRSWFATGPWPDLAAVASLLAIALAAAALLRWHEITDAVSSAQPVPAQVEGVVNQENRIVQNHFASVVDVKPGPFRWLVLKLVLKAIHLKAAFDDNQGSLSGITSIHFARWVVIDGGRKLLFLSNYDGSWENYLDDFIDRASAGLTAIWSNTTGFPRTCWLVNGGARDELLFKTLVRRSQIPSLVWYSAYADLTTDNIRSNATIREGLSTPMDEAAAAAWLANF